MSAATVPLPLKFNCGFCRVSIKELSSHDDETREKKFKEQFSSALNLDDSLFSVKSERHTPFFNRRCSDVKKWFTKKWDPSSSRVDYLSTFSISKWEALSTQDKRKHSLSQCERCRQKYNDLQKSFPAKPVFENELCSKVSEIISHGNQATKKKTVESVLTPNLAQSSF